IYVSPNDHHLVLHKNTMLVRRGPKENSFRPSIDVLFRSAAYLHGKRVIGVILSGILNDGVSGLRAIKQLGGKAIVQAPESADQPQLPRNVLDCVDVDHVMDVEDMPKLLAGMVYNDGLDPKALKEAEMERMLTEIAIASSGSAFDLGIMDMGLATSLTCSEC